MYFTAISFSFPLQSYPRSIAAIYKNKLHKEIPNVTTDFPLDITRASRSKLIRSPTYVTHSTGRVGHRVEGRRYDAFPKTGIKRGVDIGVHVKIPSTPQYKDSLLKLENALAKVLDGRLGGALNTSGCPSCDEEKEVEDLGKHTVRPAYKCDEWDPKLRICILERNIGDTVTFFLSIGHYEGHKPNVTWKKEFHVQEIKRRSEFIINTENSPENIIIGRKGYELRISPITETDLGYNMFSATLHGHTSPQGKVSFMVRVVPIDLGFIYVGETIELNLRSFVSLPEESLTFRWYMEKDGERGTLPSNMRVSSTGNSIKISELRQEQEGILSCSVYTNLELLATKKRFFIKDLIKNNDVLKSIPDHDLHFEEEIERDKRFPKKLLRNKRSENVDDIVEKALMESTTRSKHHETTQHGKSTLPYDDYDLEKDVGTEHTKAKAHGSVTESLDDRIRDLNYNMNEHRESELTKEDYNSLVNNPDVEQEEPQGNPLYFDETQLQNGDGGKSPELESFDIPDSMRDQAVPEQKLYNQYSDLRDQEYGGKFANVHANHGTPLLPSSSKKVVDNYRQHSGVDIGKKKGNYATQNDESGIVLNIDKIPGPRRVSAEEKIAKMISYCYIDLECSAKAICVRSNLKLPGFCKCLPGFYGVGIFCREDIWVSNSNFEVNELQNPEEAPYSGSEIAR